MASTETNPEISAYQEPRSSSLIRVPLVRSVGVDFLRPGEGYRLKEIDGAEAVLAPRQNRVFNYPPVRVTDKPKTNP